MHDEKPNTTTKDTRSQTPPNKNHTSDTGSLITELTGMDYKEKLRFSEKLRFRDSSEIRREAFYAFLEPGSVKNCDN